jgi:hypothetical protein
LEEAEVFLIVGERLIMNRTAEGQPKGSPLFRVPIKFGRFKFELAEGGLHAESLGLGRARERTGRDRRRGMIGLGIGRMEVGWKRERTTIF